MPNIKVIYWNVENFGDPQNGRRGNYVPLCNFIARVVRNVDADILCLMEVRNTAMARLRRLQRALLNAYHIGGVQTCDWYADWVPGSLIYNAFGPAYSPNNVGFTLQGRNEGYAVFWKQNIDKFLMQEADTIISANATPPGHVAGANVPNTQSGGVRARGAGAALNLLPADIVIAAATPQYTLPAGSTTGAAGIMRGAGVVVHPNVFTAAPTQLHAGDLISAGTQIADAGVRLTNAVLGVNPIVVPGQYRLTTNLILPAAGATIVSRHVLSLVLSSKQIVGGATANYNPAAANNWELGSFPATAGANLWNGSRRPAYCTIKTNTAPPATQQLIPITFYHAPLAAPPQAMGRCAIAQPLYEAMNLGAPPYLHNARAIVGGDFNARLNPAAAHYAIYTNAYAANGADCHHLGNQNIRVNNPAPGVAPVFPPPGNPLTVADNPENKSSIQLRHPVIGPNQRVLSFDVDHYRRLAIDNIFYRGFTPAQAPRFVFRATPPPGGAQQQFTADLYDLVRAVCEAIPPAAAAAPAGAPPDNFFIPPGIITAFNGLAIAGILPIINPAQLLADMNAGVFQTPAGGNPPAGAGPYAGPAPLPIVITPERRAAEFIKLYVSDHLPVIFQMVI
jgi:hypothetical protein